MQSEIAWSCDGEEEAERPDGPVHRVGDVGLVVAQHPRGFGEILIFRDIIKDFVIFPVHIHGGVPSFMSILYRDHVQDTFYTFSAC